MIRGNIANLFCEGKTEPCPIWRCSVPSPSVVQVREIRRLCASGAKQSDVAIDFDIGAPLVSKINSRKRYADVD